MTDIIQWLIAVPTGYLIGSIPVGVVAGRLLKGVDVRSYGSGSTGATNVARTAGWRAGLLVLIFDVFKGALAVSLIRIISDSTVVESLAAVFVIAGHNWPIFTGFKGGKGVATGLGALGVISPYAGLLTIIGPLVTIATKYVSLGSMLAALVSSGFLVIQIITLNYSDEGYLIFAFAGFSLVMWQHRANIVRLARGEENKFGVPVDIEKTITGHK